MCLFVVASTGEAASKLVSYAGKGHATFLVSNFMGNKLGFLSVSRNQTC